VSNKVSRKVWHALASGIAMIGLTVLPGTAALGAGGSGDTVAFTAGGGHYKIGDELLIKFSFAAVTAEATADGTLLTGPAHGRFRQSVVLDGLLVEFQGEATCVTVDPANGRGWVGGIVTSNTSEHPAFLTDIHQPGRDVWFRVLDSGEGAGAMPDRSTFLGFEGAAGIITSPEYCETAVWPDDNARTNAIIRGNIQVRP
jgi:hypothetical protein